MGTTIFAATGETIPLSLQLSNAATDKYPQVKIFDRLGTLTPVDTVNLAHVATGLYMGEWLVPERSKWTASYTVYDDAGRTVLSAGYERDIDYIVSDAVQEPEVEVSFIDPERSP